MSQPQVALVAREIRPFGGGIGTYVAALARFLAADAEVTVFVSDSRRDEMGDPEVRRAAQLDDRVKLVFVTDKYQVGSYYGHLHRYSANLLAALKREYGARGPDVIEFQDYLGEGAVTLQARVTRDPFLAHTSVMVRINTTGEICAVLDGYVDSSSHARHISTMERFSLRFADRLLYGGGDIYGLYRRYYGPNGLANGERVRQPLGPEGPLPPKRGVDVDDGRLRLLYMGRLERRKGVADLVRAMSTLTEDASLTLVGNDTPTAPLGTGMKALLEQGLFNSSNQEASDIEIDFAGPVAPQDIPSLIDRHHVVVIPSIWECWPAVGLEALARNRPLLGSPVGGLTEMIQPDSGWHLPTPRDPSGIADAIEGLARNRSAIRALIDAGSPRAAHERLCDPDELREWYLERVPSSVASRPHRRPPGDRPLVSVVVPYYRMPQFVEDTLNSILAQTYPRVEVIIVNDGSFELDDRRMVSLARRYNLHVAVQPNSGLGAARNFGIKLSRGRYVALLDADNLYEPRFVERAVDVLQSQPDIAYVSSWSRYIDDRGAPLHGPGAGYQPFGNFSELLSEENVAGDAAAVIRRAVFDRGFWFSEELTSYEDWDFYRRLQSAGLVGHCIPERLMRYRVREGSMVREVGLAETVRLQGELLASQIEGDVTWG